MTNNNRLWILVVSILAVAIVALGWFLGVSPKLAQAHDSDVQTAQVNAENLARSAQTVKLKADFENLASISAQLAELQAQLPSNSDYPAFLAELNQIAGDHSVTVTNVAFTNPLIVSGNAGPSPSATPTAAATTPATAAPAPISNAATAGSTVAIPTTLTFAGTFAQLQAATGALQSGTRLFLVSGLKFQQAQAIGTDGKAQSTSDYTVDVTGLLYVLTDGSTLVTTSSTPVPTTTPTAAP